MADMKTPTNIAFGTDGWRAIMNDEFIFDNLALVAQSVSDFINEKGNAKQGVVIGWDARFMSEDFGQLVANVLTSNGIPVLLPERDTPTPVIAYTVLNRKMAGGIMISASHNPPKYNGIKFIPDYGHPALPEITDKLTAGVKKLQADGTTPNRSGNTSLMEKFDPKPEYFAHLSKLFNLDAIAKANLKIWYDPLYATGRGYIDEFLRNIGVDVTTIHGERNPLFGGSLPDPNEKNLAEIAQRVVESGANVGLGTDGDADRFGVVDATGKYLTPNQVLCLAILHWQRTRYQTGSVVRTAPTTHQVDALAKHFGLGVQVTPVGFKWVGNALATTDAIVGGEESGGLSVKGHIPEKDGIAADLIIVEQIAMTGKTPLQTLQEIDEMVGTFVTGRVDVHLENEKKNALMNTLRNNPPANFAGQQVTGTSEIDGVQLDLADGSWVLVRPSGTEPLVRCYYETSTDSEATKLVSELEKEIGPGEVH